MKKSRDIAFWFLMGLGIILPGYALLGRGFAYVGVNPLFVGEMVLGLGMLALFRADLMTLCKQRGIQLVLILLGWGAFCTLPYLGRYGLDAVRDAMLYAYALYAIAVAAVLISQPVRFRQMLLWFRKYAYVFLGLAWLTYIISEMAPDLVPPFPGSRVSLVAPKGGDMLVHLSAVAGFVLLGMTRHRPILLALVLLNLAVLFVSKRAGMISFALAMMILLMARPPRVRLVSMAYAGVLALIVLVIANPEIKLRGQRPISLEQVFNSFASMVTDSGNADLDTSKTWRLDWWSQIAGYTFGGEYFLTGKGFGINLATDDGYQVLRGDALRSPHNGHLNMLARSGVPGFSIWMLVHLYLIVALSSRILRARRNYDDDWASIFAVLLAYHAALLANASFDVFLEGPMGGIWLWSLYGAAIAGIHLYDSAPGVGRDRLRAAAASQRTVRPPRRFARQFRNREVSR